MYGRQEYADLRIRALAQPMDLQGLQRLNPARYPFLLQSSATDTPLGRYDILFACPGDMLQLDGNGGLSGPYRAAGKGFLSALNRWWQADGRPVTETGLPFTGGWFLYLGYELAAEIEPSLGLRRDADLPTAFAVRCPAAIIHDHRDDRTCLVAEDSAPITGEDVLADAAMAASRSVGDIALRAPGIREERAEIFLGAVAKAKRYIVAGDIYQANLSRGWTASVDERLDPDRVYASLCRTNPAPFGGMVRWRNTAIISSSPERLLQVRGGIVSTRPIAGTRPRSEDRVLDDSLSAELFAHPKERAEHVMLIDLERNDLGRVCRPGTVEVDEMMVLESYAHVHHIVSNIRGRLRPGTPPGDVIAAVFPGGTITGCPKVRCMQIISELEVLPRGAYTGSFGYLNRDGSLDLNILIRTMVMQGNTVSLRAGSGIVADSEPAAELAETRAKAEGMLRALAV